MSLLARFSLGNRALVALATIFATLGGFWAITALDRELIPDLELPVVGVVTVLPGASPEFIDEQVSRPIAQAATSVSGLEGTSATSNANMSTVMLELEYGTSAAAAQQQLQVAISRIDLPDDAQTQVISGSISDLPVVQLSVAGGENLDALAATLREQVIPELERIDGVQGVALSGATSSSIDVSLDEEALGAAGLGPQDVVDAIEAAGFVVPAGSVEDADRTLNVQVGQPLDALEQIGEILIPSTADPQIDPVTGAVTPPAPIRLSQVAQVESVPDAAASFSRTEGQDSLGLAITRAADGNVVAISDAVTDAMPQLRAMVGEGVDIQVVFDQAPFINDSIKDLSTEGLLGLAFAIAVILVFLRQWRATAVTAISIPLSLLIAVMGLQVGGYSLNMFTLAALTISIGRVVDDSIVVIENIERHLSYGVPRREAILTGVREVGGAITSATVATAAVFVPMGLVSGMVGELFRPFAFTAALALMASLLVALTIVPVLAYWFLPRPDPSVDPGKVQREAVEKERASFTSRHYVRTLRAAMKRPVLTVLVGVAVLVGTVALTPLLKTDFLGDTGENTLSVTQQLPPATSVAAQSEAARAVEDVINEIPQVETYQVSGGSGDAAMAFLGLGGDTTFSITIDPDADMAEVEADLRSRLAELTDSGNLSISAGANAGFASSLEVLVTAPNPEALSQAADQVFEVMSNLEGATDAQNNLSADLPTIVVNIDNEAAAAAGLDRTMIGGAVAVAFNGMPAGEIHEGAVTTEISVRMGTEPATVAELEQLVLGAGPDGPLLLTDVATVEEVEVSTAITRSNGVQSATITANTSADDLGSQSSQLRGELEALDLPDGAFAEVTGVSAEQDSAFESLGLALLLSIAIVYLVMVATFKSLIQPFILLISIPFAATGAIIALLITQVPLGVAGMIGALMLVGVVVTNAIVLIDLMNQYRRAGMSLDEAIIEGGRHRLRPILMTAFATIGALFPMALGFTGGSAFISQPLGLVVIGGLLSSTFLTLLLVPVFYRLVEARGERKRLAEADEVAGGEISGGSVTHDDGHGDHDAAIDDATPLRETDVDGDGHSEAAQSESTESRREARIRRQTGEADEENSGG